MENVNLVIQEGEKLEDPGKIPHSKERTKKKKSQLACGPGVQLNPVQYILVGGRQSHNCHLCYLSDVMNLGASPVFFFLVEFR